MVTSLCVFKHNSLSDLSRAHMDLISKCNKTHYKKLSDEMEIKFVLCDLYLSECKHVSLQIKAPPLQDIEQSDISDTENNL